MQFTFFIPKLTLMNTSIMNFISQKFRDSAVMSQMFVSKSWIWEVSTADPLSSSQTFILSFPPTVPQKFSSPIYLPNESTLGQHLPIFRFLPPRFLAHETSGSKPCDLWCVMNRPFAKNNHMVQNPPCWRAIPQWDIKAKASHAWLLGVSFFWSPNAGSE